MIRMVRVAFSFVIVVVAYVAYSILVVPAIEPPADPRSDDGGVPLDFAASDVSERARELTPLFPPDSWQVKNPKILDNNQSKLLFQDYTVRSNGEVELHPCTIVYDPGGPPVDAVARIRRCVVIDSPGGAILRFDRPLQLGRAEIGHLIGGRLLGTVTIRGEGQSSGREDDLRVVTNDIQLSEREIWTTDVVDFHFGRSNGRGKEMHIRLAPGDDSQPSNSPGPNVGGLESFELTHVERLHLEPRAAKRPPPPTSAPAATSPAPAAIISGGNADLARLPMEISCHGPLQFDMARQEATFRDQVDVWRIVPNGPADHLSCELLTLHFARKRANQAHPAGQEDVAKKKTGLADLEAQWIRAEGDPIVLDSQIQGVLASGQQLEYDLWTGSISLESTVEAWMRQGTNEIHALTLRYQPGPPGRLGQVQARGPGWFRGQMRQKQPQRLGAQKQPQQLEGHWKDQLQIRPQGLKQVISLTGDADLRFPDFGELTAREIHFWLIEQPQAGGPAANKLQPDQMLALHDVRIHSPQLDGTVAQLEVFFEQSPKAAASGDGQPRGHFDPATPPVTPPALSDYHLPATPVVRTVAYFPAADPRASSQHYQIVGQRMRARVVLHDQQQAELTELMVQDGVRFLETQTAQPNDRPVLITGDLIDALDPNLPQAVVTVVGQPAHFEGRGKTLDGPNINVDRGANRLWVVGPGQMQLPMERDLEGHPLARPGELNIVWHRQMTFFDGLVARFEESVSARSAQGQLKTQVLEVHFKQAIRFGEGNPQSPGQGLSQIFCRGGADLENATFDPRGQATQERLQTADLSIDMLSGELHAAGPGCLCRVERGSSESTALLAPPGTAPHRTAPAPQGNDTTLTCLDVRFQGALTGNIHRQEVTFHDQVRAVRAPVDRWEASLDPDKPEQLDPRGVLMRCDQLWVAEMPTPVEGRRAPELQATGNAVVDSQDFTARALRISYIQAKGLLILEGDGWTDAELYRQQQIGGNRDRLAAQRIEYRPETRAVSVNNAHAMDFNAIPAGKAWK